MRTSGFKMSKMSPVVRAFVSSALWSRSLAFADVAAMLARVALRTQQRAVVHWKAAVVARKQKQPLWRAYVTSDGLS